MYALEGNLVREVLDCDADLLGNLLSKGTLDGELLGQLPQYRDHLR
ncbi:MAG: hypothetical protein WA825_02600 [Steroidobacteraceae bacterium]